MGKIRCLLLVLVILLCSLETACASSYMDDVNEAAKVDVFMSMYLGMPESEFIENFRSTDWIQTRVNRGKDSYAGCSFTAYHMAKKVPEKIPVKEELYVMFRDGKLGEASFKFTTTQIGAIRMLGQRAFSRIKEQLGPAEQSIENRDSQYWLYNNKQSMITHTVSKSDHKKMYILIFHKAIPWEWYASKGF